MPFSLSYRVISRLVGMEEHEPDAHLRDDYRQARLVMVHARDGSPIPFIEASYDLFGAHPDRVWERVGAKRKAVLGTEYSQVFDESGNLRHQFLDIPDYDPMSGQPPLLSRRAEMDKKRWTPKAPLRRVLQVHEIHAGKRSVYHLEQLECGHVHTEFLGENPGNRRRRCVECSKGVPKKQPQFWRELEDAQLLVVGEARGPKRRTGNLYTMPSPRSSEQKALRILPA